MERPARERSADLESTGDSESPQADLAVVSTRVQPAPASGTVLDPRLLAVMRTVSASVDSAAAVDIVGGAVSALMLLGDYVRALLEEAGADEAV
ncbi:hypothetical protein CLOP_g22510 [Closterium sp. NIES-67]|nr:hypothetical protein CLOP_g22510 [Closterium sp. NIES-67]